MLSSPKSSFSPQLITGYSELQYLNLENLVLLAISNILGIPFVMLSDPWIMVFYSFLSVMISERILENLETISATYFNCTLRKYKILFEGIRINSMFQKFVAIIWHLTVICEHHNIVEVAVLLILCRLCDVLVTIAPNYMMQEEYGGLRKLIKIAPMIDIVPSSFLTPFAVKELSLRMMSKIKQRPRVAPCLYLIKWVRSQQNQTSSDFLDIISECLDEEVLRTELRGYVGYSRSREQAIAVALKNGLEPELEFLQLQRLHFYIRMILSNCCFLLPEELFHHMLVVAICNSRDKLIPLYTD